MKYADLSTEQARKVDSVIKYDRQAQRSWFDNLPPEKQAEYTTLEGYEAWKLIDCQPTEDCDVKCEVADPSGKRFRFVIEGDFGEWGDLKYFYRYTVPADIDFYIEQAAGNNELEAVDPDEGDELGEEVGA
jgi:hypothetical protein